MPLIMHALFLVYAALHFNRTAVFEACGMSFISAYLLACQCVGKVWTTHASSTVSRGTWTTTVSKQLVGTLCSGKAGCGQVALQQNDESTSSKPCRLHLRINKHTSFTGEHVIPLPVKPTGQGPHWNFVSEIGVQVTKEL